MTEIVQTDRDHESGFANTTINGFSNDVLSILNQPDYAQDRQNIKQFEELNWEFEDQHSSNNSMTTEDTIVLTYKQGDFKTLGQNFENQSFLHSQEIYYSSTPPLKSLDFLASQRYQDPQLTIFWGVVTILLTFMGFTALSFWMVGAKLLPETGNPIIDFMRTDYHYCMALPLLYPVFYIFVFQNWSSLKIFRHN